LCHADTVINAAPEGLSFPTRDRRLWVWAYHRFALSTADVEDLLAERGVIVSREAIRLWVNRFGAHFATEPGEARRAVAGRSLGTNVSNRS